MAAKFPERITPENASSAWEQADKLLRRGKKGSVIYRTASFAAFPVFTLLILVPVLRYLEQRGIGMSGFVLDKLPRVLEIWDRIHGYFFQNVSSPVSTALAYVQMLYLLPFAVGLVPAAVLFLLYHPGKNKLSASVNTPESAGALLQMLQDAKKRAKEIALTRYLCSPIFGIIPSGIVLFNYYTPLDGPSRMDMVTDNIMGFPHVYFVGVPLMMLGVLALMLVFWIAALPLNRMLRLFSLNPVPRKTLDSAMVWAHQGEMEQSAQFTEAPQNEERQV